MEPSRSSPRPPLPVLATLLLPLGIAAVLLQQTAVVLFGMARMVSSADEDDNVWLPFAGLLIVLYVVIIAVLVRGVYVLFRRGRSGQLFTALGAVCFVALSLLLTGVSNGAVTAGALAVLLVPPAVLAVAGLASRTDSFQRWAAERRSR
ncbi:hypothetical protein [Spirillospora sp. NPDC029432]|uniref:hypothetical protein n=1 Tax=Spirillospora sp. NPDC029432 TaxID=3154599 RepID=UPI003455C4B6